MIKSSDLRKKKLTVTRVDSNPRDWHKSSNIISSFLPTASQTSGLNHAVCNIILRLYCSIENFLRLFIFCGRNGSDNMMSPHDEWLDLFTWLVSSSFKQQNLASKSSQGLFPICKFWRHINLSICYFYFFYKFKITRNLWKHHEPNLDLGWYYLEKGLLLN